ncbi:hypothetical protein N9948_01270 [bacterium]|nr:hypothetical protein [bacterium]
MTDEKFNEKVKRIAKSIIAWHPSEKQRKFWEELSEVDKKPGTLDQKDAVALAKKMKLNWSDVADMSEHEGFWNYQDPTYMLRRIRNSPEDRKELS